MKNDFDLDLFSTGLLAASIETIHSLQAELRRLRAQQPARTVVAEVTFASVELPAGNGAQDGRQGRPG